MNRRDIELLSTYLDGELKSVDSARLETRLKTDPELASVLSDLRATRTLLRKLPSRKAPRNFTLTRRMVGQNPPLPRTYPVFRFTTAIATLLFLFSFAANALGPQLAQPYGFGRGGGGGAADTEMYAEAPSMAEPAAPLAEAPMAPAPAEEPALSQDSAEAGAPATSLVPQPTLIAPVEDATRIMETPSSKTGEAENAAGEPVQPPVPEEAMTQMEAPSPAPWISSAWQIGLVVIAVISALLMGLMRQLSARRWK